MGSLCFTFSSPLANSGSPGHGQSQLQWAENEKDLSSRKVVEVNLNPHGYA